jgi:hypothetical protein
MPLWDFFAWFFWFSLAVTCIWIFITVFIDLFRDDSLSGVAKAVWVLFLVFLPFLGAVVYLIARSGSMAARRAREREYVTEANGLVRP